MIHIEGLHFLGTTWVLYPSSILVLLFLILHFRQRGDLEHQQQELDENVSNMRLVFSFEHLPCEAKGLGYLNQNARVTFCHW
jgi:hypothetical protein